MELTAYAIGIVTGLFLLYLYLTETTFIEKKLSKRINPESAQARQIIFNRFLGFFLFGAVSLWLMFTLKCQHPWQLGLEWTITSKTAIIILAIAIIPIFVNRVAAKTSDNLAMYPQIRVKKWNLPLLVISSLSWVMYLLGYETMLRGVLFFSCLQEIALVPAIIINTSIYALIHIPKGMKETLGSIPMGIVLCLVTFYTGSIWGAFFIHCSLALSNEWFSIKYSNWTL